ncbi:MAG TPA: PAS domain-containing protein, partial [Alphaproteobacteria bacterium]|nr:PAS domain-containing protein [Alphaproteobacteria bacterium]
MTLEEEPQEQPEPPLKTERFSSGRVAMLLVPIVGTLLSVVMAFFIVLGLFESNRIQSNNQVVAITSNYQERLSKLDGLMRAMQILMRSSAHVDNADFKNLANTLSQGSPIATNIFWMLAKENEPYAAINRYGDDVQENLIVNLFNSNAALQQARNEANQGRLGIVLKVPGTMLGIQDPSSAIFVAAGKTPAGQVGYIVSVVPELFPAQLTGDNMYVSDLSVAMPNRANPVILYQEAASKPISTLLPLQDVTRSLSFSNQFWQMKMKVSEIGERSNMMLLTPLVIFLAGLGFTYVLTNYINAAQKRQMRVASMATSLERTNRELKNRIGERDQIAETLRNNEREFKAIIDRVSDVIFDTNALGSISYVNASWTFLTGFDIRDTLTKSVFDFIHESDRQNLQTHFNQAMAG